MNKLGNYSRNETDYDGPNDRHWSVLPLKATTTTLCLMIAEIKRGHRDGEGRRPRYGTKHWGALCSHSCMNTEAMRPPKFRQPAVRRNYRYFDNGMSNIDAIPLWV